MRETRVTRTARRVSATLQSLEAETALCECSEMSWIWELELLTPADLRRELQEHCLRRRERLAALYAQLRDGYPIV